MRDRSVLELVVLTLTAVVGFTLVGAGATIAYVEVRDPDVDAWAAVVALAGTVSTILGALLGLLAGRSRFSVDLSRRPTDDELEEPPR